MRSIIYKTVVLPASAEALYDMYLDPSVHEAITGAPVQIKDEIGFKFQAFNGMLTGAILHVVRPRLIVQSWRSASFKAEDTDSTLFISFTPEVKSGRIDLVHLDVPDHDYDGVSQGWEKRYFTPWRTYLENR